MNVLRMAMLASVAGTFSTAVEAAENVKIGPPPAWVVAQSIPADKGSDAPVAVLLKDEQISLRSGTISTYREVAFKIQNSEGLSAGNVALVWQPATESVTVHKIHIIRDGKVIDVLGKGQTFTILRRETNLDAATLDGTLTATMQPEGLQVGDIVDLSSTIDHSDPVMKGHLEAIYAGWDELPITAAHASVEWPASAHMNVRQTPNLPPARRTSSGGASKLDLIGRDIQPLVSPKQAPLRFAIGRMAEASDFASWSDVADLMRPLYQTASVIPASGPLHDEVEKIRAESSDPMERGAQALALVQNRVRYVALLMGQGGYVPATAAETWSRRFGDCKAKTALLLGILQSLGIRAEPVLAGIKVGDVIADRLPSIGLFNHVLVRAHIGPKDYWLDGTRTGDTDLGALEIPDFGWVLPLTERASLVHLVPTPYSKPNLERSVEIDARGGIFADEPITISEVYRGDAAVALNTAYAAATAEQRNESLRSKARTYFDGFSVTKSNTQFDKAKREFTISIAGSAKLNWKDGWFYVPTSSIGYDADFDRTAGPNHDAPVSVDYPSFLHDRATVRLPTGFAKGQKLSAPIHETLAGVEYSRTEQRDGDNLVVDSSERSVQPEIPYKLALADTARLRAISKDDVYLNGNAAYHASSQDLSSLAQQTPVSAVDYVTRGNLYLNALQLDNALADYSAAAKLDPSNQWALADRGLTYVWKHDYEKAEADLAAAAKLNSNNSVVFRAHGLMAQMKGDCPSAIRYYSQSLAAESGNSFTLGHRAQCESLEAANDEAALADTAETLKQDPSWGEMHLLRASIFKRQGKMDAAAAEAQALIDSDPTSDASWMAAGRIYSVTGNRAKAMEALNRAISIKPTALNYINRAVSRPTGDHAGRVADMDAAIKLDPKDSSWVTMKADEMNSVGDKTSALALYEQALKIDPEDFQTSLRRAVLLYRSGKSAEATKLLAALRTRAKEPVLLNNLCWEQATYGIQLQIALEECQEALKLKPETPQFEDSLGMALLKLGRYDEAIAAYDKAIAGGTGAISYVGRSVAYARKGDQQRATADRKSALASDPDIGTRAKRYDLSF